MFDLTGISKTDFKLVLSEIKENEVLKGEDGVDTIISSKNFSRAYKNKTQISEQEFNFVLKTLDKIKNKK